MFSFFSGLVGLAATLSKLYAEWRILQTGKDLQKGVQDAKTIGSIKKAADARSRNNDALDDELRID